MNNHYINLHRLRSGWVFLGMFLLCSIIAQAQTTRYTLKGRITDENGLALPGATVLLVGTTTGSASDADGNYTIGASLKPGPATLAVSAIGYETARQAITLGTSEIITTDLSLKVAETNLDEVVVTGSTLSAPKRELGNQISTIRAQDLQQSGSGNLINSLQGKVPGAQITQNSGDPAGGISIRLRGIKSLVGSSDPLYIIDGVIVSNASTNVSQLALANDVGNANVGQNRLSDINPDDIASLNVINGAAAAAQYGSRAANGVVIITTKRGNTGKAQVNFSTSFNINELRKSVPVNTYGKQFGFAALRLYTIGGISAAQIAANPEPLLPAFSATVPPPSWLLTWSTCSATTTSTKFSVPAPAPTTTCRFLVVVTTPSIMRRLATSKTKVLSKAPTLRGTTFALAWISD